MNPPAVAIVHHHLRRGGVTRVIGTASGCLAKAGIPHVILAGFGPESPGKLPHRVIDSLDYDPAVPQTALQLVHSLRKAVREALGDQPFVWHFHNHSIGKNPILTDAVGILAESGDPMVLQYHDFAEDGRPANYASIAARETLYPRAPQILHAFINSRDLRHFTAAGLPAEQCTLLPNAVTPPARVKPPAAPPDHPLVLYPVRGIRRKNLGELFLLASLAPAGTRFAVSLAPANPHWHPIHEEWSAFAEDTGLPVILAAVGRVAPTPEATPTFASWVRHSTHFITTSVAEGFGLGFLEPATIGKPLLGRNLPMVTDDFAADGITPGRLYDRLLVPESWVGLETLRQRLVRTLRTTLETYGQPMSNQHLERTFAAIRQRGHLDFGNLPEDLQRQVIHRLLTGSGHEQVLAETAGETVPLARWLSRTLKLTSPTVRPGELAPYSPATYLERLTSIHRQVLAASPEPPRYLPKHKVLAQFTKPGSFHFLRS